MPVTTFDADRSRHVGIRPRPIRDARGRLQLPFEVLSWRTWKPPECPNVEGLLWRDTPWHEPVSGMTIDIDATEQLRSPTWDAPLRTGVGGVSSQNVHGGSPWQDVTGCELCTVWETGEADGADLMPWVWTKHLVPLPPVVRRYDDPTGHQDTQWVGFDRDRMIMWECGAMRPIPGKPNEWVARAVKAWDLTQPWDAEPGGCTATWLPLVAGIPRYEEFQRGYIDHALWFVAARYSAREVRYPARATDGLYWDSPLVAGQRLALRADWTPRTALTPDQRTLVNAMKVDTGYGFIVTDRTHPDHGSAMRHAMDPRIVIPDLGIRQRDLVALQ